MRDGCKTLASAARGVIPGNVQAMLSGHIHTFEVMSYMGDLPIQIVSGNGGDKLEENPLAHFDGRPIDGIDLGSGFSQTPASYGDRAYLLSNAGTLVGLQVLPPR